MTRYLVTGGAGFIGFNLVRELLAHEPACEVIVLDKLTYAGNAHSLAELAAEPRFSFVRADIGDRERVRTLLATVRPEIVFHLAAESHVDRSIDAPAEFITTNLVGTFSLLEECRRYVADGAPAGFRFVHVSTDEVFGALGAEGRFVEETAYAPRSPYAASKAGSDHIVGAYVHTYGFPAIITNCSNNFGPYQFPEKLIPLVITRAVQGAPLPVYGKGENVRDWIFVTDHCAALRAVSTRGRLGESYLIGARSERKNLDVVHAICDLLDELRPRAGAHRELIEFVADRPGHDFRYAIDPSKLERELGWHPVVDFTTGLRRTIEWYLDHPAWVAAIQARNHRKVA
ncbi:MAG: dTDP-glucose 4,6-dehydratase [Kofleriaceae bacterium]|nr:dTDP-glucose 4,6-dehydratase [Kofleriaceae bacterium]